MAFWDDFKFYDYTFFQSKPAAGPGKTATVYDRVARGLLPGFSPIQAESRAWWNSPSTPNTYSKANCQAWAETLNEDIPVVLDTEGLLGGYSDAEIDQVNRLVADIKAVKKRAQIGCYNALPRKSGAWLWAVYGEGGQGQSLYTDYLTTNARLRRKPSRTINKLSLLVDFIVPDMYLALPGEWGLGLNTAYRSGWRKWTQRFVQGHVAEARKFGKPVYPAAWFEIHGGGSDGDLWGEIVPDDVIDTFMGSLKTCADGVMLWGGFHFTKPAIPASQGGEETGAPATWSSQSGWWDRVQVYV